MILNEKWLFLHIVMSNFTEELAKLHQLSGADFPWHVGTSILHRQYCPQISVRKRAPNHQFDGFIVIKQLL